MAGRMSKEGQERIALKIDSDAREAVKSARKQETIRDYDRYKIFDRLAATTDRLAELVAEGGLTALETDRFGDALKSIERIARQIRATEQS